MTNSQKESRDSQILELLTKGYTHKEIARVVHCSMRAVSDVRNAKFGGNLMGRERIYINNAERQRAYRKRLKEKSDGDQLDDKKLEVIDSKSFIYFIQDDNNRFIKIGITTNLEQRLAQLQTANPYKLKMLVAFEGTVQDETMLHYIFKDLRHHREWFYRDQRILDFIESVKEKQKESQDFNEIQNCVKQLVLTEILDNI